MEKDKNILDFIKAKKPDLRKDYFKPEIKQNYSKPAIKPNYFDDFNKDMLSKIKNEKKKKTIFKRPLFWVTGAAASLLLILGINYFSEEKINFESIQNNEIIAYVEENIEDFDVELIAGEVEQEKNESNILTIPKNEISNKEVIPSKSVNEIMETISSEDLYEYINDEELQIETIE